MVNGHLRRSRARASGVSQRSSAEARSGGRRCLLARRRGGGRQVDAGPGRPGGTWPRGSRGRREPGRHGARTARSRRCSGSCTVRARCQSREHCAVASRGSAPGARSSRPRRATGRVSLRGDPLGARRGRSVGSAVTVFLDDLQWADHATLSSCPPRPVARRANRWRSSPPIEATTSPAPHPLRRMRAELRRAGTPAGGRDRTVRCRHAPRNSSRLTLGSAASPGAVARRSSTGPTGLRSSSRSSGRRSPPADA